MKKTVTVTVVFPQTFQFEYDNMDSMEEIQSDMKDHAAYLMEGSQSDPVITSCSNSEFEE